MTAALLATHQTWVCPNGCGQRYESDRFLPNRFHTCPRGRFIPVTPMVLEGTSAKITIVERQDYVGRENVQLDPTGRPVMALVTERADGSNDTLVFVPTAVGRDINLPRARRLVGAPQGVKR